MIFDIYGQTRDSSELDFDHMTYNEMHKLLQKMGLSVPTRCFLGMRVMLSAGVSC